MAHPVKRESSLSSQRPGVKFGETSCEMLSDVLAGLNKQNKDTLSSLVKCNGAFKDNPKAVEVIFLMTEQLKLDPMVGYHAIEIHDRFMIKHIEDLLTTQAAAADQPVNHEEVVFEKLRNEFILRTFSCVQIASKLYLHTNIIDLNIGAGFLLLMGHTVSKQALLQSELMILKTLKFNLNIPSALTYVETLLDVLGHNEPSIPVERLHRLCCHVLKFTCLEKTAIYESLLVATSGPNPSREQREKFVPVTKDCMLLGAGVIAVATFILNISKWDQVVGALSYITGISKQSLIDFTHVTVMHITKICHFSLSNLSSTGSTSNASL